jgi:transposase-like protein
MSEKRKSGEIVESASKKRRTITMETKVEIIKRSEKGEKMVDIARTCGMSPSTIGTIVRDKDRIMQHVKSSVPMQSTIISKKRGIVIEEMEKLLSVWIEDQHQRRMPLSFMLIQEKALSLFKDLKAKHGESVAGDTFNASHGWFNRFKARAKLHNIKVTGEAASADTVAATEFPKALAEIIDDENYLPQQVFNVDETGLYWKKNAR